MGTLAAGIKDIFSTAKTTGTNVMLSGNDGTPDGHMTMANLASVLGVEKHGGYLEDANVESLVSGYYLVNYDTANTPVSSYGILAHFPASNGSLVFQIIKNHYPDDGTYIRHKWNSWTSWHKIEVDIPAFYKSYSDLASLSSAVGGLPLVQSTGITKFEDIKQGIYQPTGGKIGSVDVPIYYGMVICFRTDNSTDFSQNDGNMLLLAIGYQGDIHYWYKWHAYGTDVWRQITTQAET